MNKRTDEELCKWLRDNSSGCYRPSAMAADRIEELLGFINLLENELDFSSMDWICTRPLTQSPCDGCRCKVD